MAQFRSPAYDRIQRPGWIDYRVSTQSEPEFFAAMTAAQAVYTRYASQWRVDCDPDHFETWTEYGPGFLSDADRRAAAKELDGVPGLIETLRRLEVPDDDSSIGGRSQESTLRISVRDPSLPTFRVASTFPPRRTADMAGDSPLAEALAASLAAVAPPEMTLSAAGDHVILADSAGRGGTWCDLHQHRRSGLAVMACSVLEALQDEATEALAVPWPHDPARGHIFHEAHAAVRDGTLHMWFGPEDDPALVLAPLPVGPDLAPYAYGSPA